MVTQAILNFFASIWTSMWNGLMGLVPAPPSWWSSLNTGPVTEFISDSNRWLAVHLLLAVGASVLALRLIAAAIVLARRVLSLFTGGGGNA